MVVTPTFPEIFFRSATSLVAHNGAIIRPQCSTMLDYEGEFACVIGTACRHASEGNALDFVAGYMLFNDSTLRDYQRFASQWTIGKNFDSTGAMGPELVTADELPPDAEASKDAPLGLAAALTVSSASGNTETANSL